MKDKCQVELNYVNKNNDQRFHVKNNSCHATLREHKYTTRGEQPSAKKQKSCQARPRPREMYILLASTIGGLFFDRRSFHRLLDFDVEVIVGRMAEVAKRSNKTSNEHT